MAIASVTCSTCGNKQTTSPQRLPRRPVVSRQDSIAQICEKMRQLEQLISPLQEEKISLLQELNELQSPLMSLPNETLSTIFELARPPVRSDTHKGEIHDEFREQAKDHFQLVLAAISSRLRQVARSTPHLWTSIVLSIVPRNAKKTAAFLEFYLDSTATTPLSLSLQFSKDFEVATKTLVHPSVDNAIVQNLARIRDLHLVRPSRAWFAHFPTLSQLVNCTLGLDHPRDYNSRETFTFSQNAPLRFLAIQEPAKRKWTTIEAPWSNVTSLNLSHIQIGPAMKMFLQCPNLAEFRYRSAGSPLRNDPVTMVVPATLQQLEVLEFWAPDCGWSRAVVQYFHLPSLKKMEWSVKFSEISFTACHPPSLQ